MESAMLLYNKKHWHQEMFKCCIHLPPTPQIYSLFPPILLRYSPSNCASNKLIIAHQSSLRVSRLLIKKDYHIHKQSYYKSSTVPSPSLEANRNSTIFHRKNNYTNILSSPVEIKQHIAGSG